MCPFLRGGDEMRRPVYVKAPVEEILLFCPFSSFLTFCIHTSIISKMETVTTALALYNCGESLSSENIFETIDIGKDKIEASGSP